MQVVGSSNGDRYAILEPIGKGGMGTVHLAQRLCAGGFARNVAIKRLHPCYVSEPDARAMFLDEARLAACVRHPHVVATLDVVEIGTEREPLLVMEYVRGAPLSRLLTIACARGERIAPTIAAAIAIDMLDGLHAAHEARGVLGEPLGIVHRDVSPQNVLVGADGFARVADFGIARAADRLHSTRSGLLKGKIGYMAPEQLEDDAEIDRRVDVFAAAIVLWESLTGCHLFRGEGIFGVAKAVLAQPIAPPSALERSIPEALDRVVLRGLARDPWERYATAREMAEAIERVVRPATPRQVGQWVAEWARASLDELDAKLSRADRGEIAPASATTLRLRRPIISAAAAAAGRRSGCTTTGRRA